MTDALKLGRRGFLKLTAAVGGAVVGPRGTRFGGAAAVGGGLASLQAEDAVTFIDPVVFPDAPVEVALRFPGAPPGAKARVVMRIETPRGPVARDLGEVRVERGEGHLRTALVYPFETRVPGAYAYVIEATLGSRRALSEGPIG